jgi:hypothetical protein
MNFITAAQKATISTVQHEEIELEHFGDVSFYFNQRKGFCYDRAVLMEKFFAHYGFPFRHVYLYFGEDGKSPTFFSLFNKNTTSHALLEVKTKKGWIVLGTNADWVGLTANGEVLNTATLKKALKQHGEPKLQNDATKGLCFWNGKGDTFNYVYGLYSRHGNFFRNSSNEVMSLFHFIPDYNFSMLFDNF